MKTRKSTVTACRLLILLYFPVRAMYTCELVAQCKCKLDKILLKQESWATVKPERRDAERNVEHK